MTPADVRARVEAIKAKAGDDEAAHGDEDELWADVLKTIAFGDGSESPRELAAEALKTESIKFERWCA